MFTNIFLLFAACGVINGRESVEEICAEKLNITIEAKDPNKKYDCLEECVFVEKFPHKSKNDTKFTDIALGYLSKPCDFHTSLEDVCERGRALQECRNHIDRELDSKCINSTLNEDKTDCYTKCIYTAKEWANEDNTFNVVPEDVSEDAEMQCYKDNLQQNPCVQFIERYKCIAGASNED